MIVSLWYCQINGFALISLFTWLIIQNSPYDIIQYHPFQITVSMPSIECWIKKGSLWNAEVKTDGRRHREKVVNFVSSAKYELSGYRIKPSHFHIIYIHSIYTGENTVLYSMMLSTWLTKWYVTFDIWKAPLHINTVFILNKALYCSLIRRILLSWRVHPKILPVLTFLSRRFGFKSEFGG